MTISDWWMIAAVISGPVLAVQIQKLIERMTYAKERKLWVFKTLMQTRGTTVSPLHVQALNMIVLEFSSESKKEKKVRDAWDIYLKHLDGGPQDDQDKNYESEMKTWIEKKNMYSDNLLLEMGKVLGYNFDMVQMKTGAYTPKAHVDFELESLFLRRGLLKVIVGNKPIYIAATEKPSSAVQMPVCNPNTDVKT